MYDEQGRSKFRLLFTGLSTFNDFLCIHTYKPSYDTQGGQTFISFFPGCHGDAHAAGHVRVRAQALGRGHGWHLAVHQHPAEDQVPIQRPVFLNG
jgi:hypothetical protein